MKRVVLFWLVLMSFSMASVAKSRVYLLGDGTMGIASDSVLIGWGDALNEYLAKGVILQNDAEAGMSLKVFLDNDGEAKIAKLPAKSFLFLQFGGNDLTDTNAEQYSNLDLFMRRYKDLIKNALDNKLQVVLCTPLARPYYKEGVLIDRLGGYDDVVRRLAKSYDLPLLDMEELTYAWWSSLSEADAAAYITNSPSNEVFLLTDAGAHEVATMAVKAIKDLKTKKVAKIIKK